MISSRCSLQNTPLHAPVWPLSTHAEFYWRESERRWLAYDRLPPERVPHPDFVKCDACNGFIYKEILPLHFCAQNPARFA